MFNVEEGASAAFPHLVMYEVDMMIEERVQVILECFFLERSIFLSFMGLNSTMKKKHS